MSIECGCEAGLHRQRERHLVKVFVSMKVEISNSVHLCHLRKDILALVPNIMLISDSMQGEVSVVCWRETNRVCDNLGCR